MKDGDIKVEDIFPKEQKEDKKETMGDNKLVIEEFEDSLEEWDFKAEDKIICPYCKHSWCVEWEDVPDDNWSEDEHECEKCGKSFIVCFERTVTHAFQSYRVKEDKQ